MIQEELQEALPGDTSGLSFRVGLGLRFFWGVEGGDSHFLLSQRLMLKGPAVEFSLRVFRRYERLSSPCCEIAGIPSRDISMCYQDYIAVPFNPSYRCHYSTVVLHRSKSSFIDFLSYNPTV